MEKEKSLVLRISGHEGDFTYRVAKLRESEARQWEDRLAAGSRTAAPESLPLSPPLNLSQVMKQLQTRDFAVVDVTAAKASA